MNPLQKTRGMRLRIWLRADVETANDTRIETLAPLTPWIFNGEQPPVHDRQLLQTSLEEWWQHDSDPGSMINDLIVCNNRIGILTLLRATKQALSMCVPPVNDAWIIRGLTAAMDWKVRTEFGGLDTLEENVVRMARDDLLDMPGDMRSDLRYRIVATALCAAWESMSPGTGFGDVLLWAAVTMINSVRLLGRARACQNLRECTVALPPIEEWLSCEFANCYGRSQSPAII